MKENHIKPKKKFCEESILSDKLNSLSAKMFKC